MTDFRHTSRACPDGPHAEFPLVDLLAVQAVLLGGNERYDRLEREYLRLTGSVEVPSSRTPTDLDPGDSVHVVVLFEQAAKAAGIPPVARRWVVPYVMAMIGWYLIQRPPHQMLLYGGLRAFEQFGAPMTVELPFLADLRATTARGSRRRSDRPRNTAAANVTALPAERRHRPRRRRSNIQECGVGSAARSDRQVWRRTPGSGTDRRDALSYEIKDTPSAPAVTPSFSLKDLLTERQASMLTQHPRTVLAQYRSWRNTGKYPGAGPDFVKVGKAVFYPRAAIDAYNRKRGV